MIRGGRDLAFAFVTIRSVGSLDHQTASTRPGGAFASFPAGTSRRSRPARRPTRTLADRPPGEIREQDGRLRRQAVAAARARSRGTDSRSPRSRRRGSRCGRRSCARDRAGRTVRGSGSGSSGSAARPRAGLDQAGVVAQPARSGSGGCSSSPGRRHGGEVKRNSRARTRRAAAASGVRAARVASACGAPSRRARATSAAPAPLARRSSASRSKRSSACFTRARAGRQRVRAEEGRDVAARGAGAERRQRLDRARREHRRHARRELRPALLHEGPGRARAPRGSPSRRVSRIATSCVRRRASVSAERERALDQRRRRGTRRAPSRKRRRSCGRARAFVAGGEVGRRSAPRRRARGEGTTGVREVRLERVAGPLEVALEARSAPRRARPAPRRPRPPGRAARRGAGASSSSSSRRGLPAEPRSAGAKAPRDPARGARPRASAPAPRARRSTSEGERPAQRREHVRVALVAEGEREVEEASRAARGRRAPAAHWWPSEAHALDGRERGRARSRARAGSPASCSGAEEAAFVGVAVDEARLARGRERDALALSSRAAAARRARALARRPTRPTHGIGQRALARASRPRLRARRRSAPARSASAASRPSRCDAPQRDEREARLLDPGAHDRLDVAPGRLGERAPQVGGDGVALAVLADVARARPSRNASAPR